MFLKGDNFSCRACPKKVRVAGLDLECCILSIVNDLKIVIGALNNNVIPCSYGCTAGHARFTDKRVIWTNRGDSNQSAWLIQRLQSHVSTGSSTRRDIGDNVIIIGGNEDVGGVGNRVAGLSLCCLRRSRITPRSTLDSLYRPRIAPRSVLIDRCCPPIARRSTLNAPRRSQIAPRSTLCARAGHGLLRVQHLESSPRVQIAPYSTLCVPRRSQIAPRSTLPAPYRLRIAPLSAIDAPCRSTDISVRLHFAPCAVHGLLRAQHFKLRTAHRLLCVRRLHFVQITDCSAFLTPCLVLLADCSVLNT